MKDESPAADKASVGNSAVSTAESAAEVQPAPVADQKSNVDPVDALVKLFKSLASAGGVVVGLLPILYAFSWRKAEGYFGELHAGWLVPSLSTTYLLTSNAEILVFAANLMYLAVIWEARQQSRGQQSKLFKVVRGLSNGSGLGLLALGSFWLKHWWGVILFAFGALLVTLDVAWTLLEIAKEFSSDLKWSLFRAGKLVGVAYLALYMAPASLGRAEAEMSIKNGSLPIITTRDGFTGRLIYASDSSLYLIAPDSQESHDWRIWIRDGKDAIVGMAPTSTRTPDGIFRPSLTPTPSPVPAPSFTPTSAPKNPRVKIATPRPPAIPTS